MKNLMIIAFLLVSFVTLSQDEVIPQLKPYEDLESKLYTSKVIEISGKSQKELLNTFKNWAGTTFVNLREVMVSETDNQIVLVYIEKVPVSMKVLLTNFNDVWSLYVRLVAEFKDGKMRVSLYDDGNVFKPGTYSQYGNVPATQARSFYISSFQTPPKTAKELTKRTGAWYLTHTKWQEKCDLTIASVDNGMKNPTATSPKRKDDF
ncbi:DUF4468 domain-containing protein [Aquirufa sp.]|jgi:hypothetical protein|uniref:DUF4468 domain-containing protein n=1 Tax=Aquirufa sp. TaxID=2676249 RepID=UPI003783CDA8